MNTDPPESQPIKAGIAPWLPVSHVTQALHFYQTAFGANELYRLEDEAGNLVVAQLVIDGADFWLQEDPDAAPAKEGHHAIRMILTVANPDVVFARAIAAGATELFPISEEHGWRMGRIIDPSGHHWEIGRPLR